MPESTSALGTELSILYGGATHAVSTSEMHTSRPARIIHRIASALLTP